LSALTPKGAGAYIARSDHGVSADMLLEFFNSVSVRTGNADDFSAVQAKKPVAEYFFSDNSVDDSQQNGLKQFSPAALIGQSDRMEYVIQCETVYQKPVPFTGARFFFFISGLSPPVC